MDRFTGLPSGGHPTTARCLRSANKEESEDDGFLPSIRIFRFTEQAAPQGRKASTTASEKWFRRFHYQAVVYARRIWCSVRRYTGLPSSDHPTPAGCLRSTNKEENKDDGFLPSIYIFRFTEQVAPQGRKASTTCSSTTVDRRTARSAPRDQRRNTPQAKKLGHMLPSSSRACLH